MMDFVEHPSFVSELLDALADLSMSVVQRAVELDVDCIHFGDDWGQQRGLLMGPRIWRQFIRPRLARLYAAVKRAGKYVSIHSCGDVDELFDDLAEIGLDLFNPFQPEVMDVFSLKRKYAGMLAFHGGAFDAKDSAVRSSCRRATRDVTTPELRIGWRLCVWTCSRC